MSSSQPFLSLMAITANLTQTLSTTERYQQLLTTVHEVLPCDASALLKLEGNILKPVATYGLSPDTHGRRFDTDEHPRLATILRSREPVRFESDCDLPDPYDGLVNDVEGKLTVHDCMGSSLYVQGKLWGVMTMDSLQVGQFSALDAATLEALFSLTAATVAVVEWVEALELKLAQQRQITNEMITEQFHHHSDDIIGDSQSMLQLGKDINTVADSDLTALITGESGTGKELVARAIHCQSQRVDNALVYVNCAALPDNLVESELFGHVKGAFSGAETQRSGKFELANKGSLFLDEIGELPLAAQAKLLRAIQFGEIQRVGADAALQVDVRIIAATNRDLQKEVKEGRFRADLYHRLCVFPLWVPPLRERDDDVMTLTGYFLEKIRIQLGIQSLRLSSSASKVMQSYSWPGNVRELEHALNRAALRARQQQSGNAIITISPQDLALEPHIEQVQAASPEKIVVESHLSLSEASDDFHRQLIEQRVADADGNWAQAARSLDMNRSNLYRLAKRLGLK
ncbi:MAG: nitric oxide reductase transcriptional regulator NorR [Pseudomonadales bacterium]|nr:nitric oxide reductase transcriptional regulator NorR [Pseudomonadales bacterium]